jgi:hypothetical protein
MVLSTGDRHIAEIVREQMTLWTARSRSFANPENIDSSADDAGTSSS